MIVRGKRTKKKNNAMHKVFEAECFWNKTLRNDQVYVLNKIDNNKFILLEYKSKENYINEVHYSKKIFSSIEDFFDEIMTLEQIMNISKIVFLEKEIFDSLLVSRIINRNILLYLVDNINNQYLLPFDEIDYLDSEEFEDQELIVKGKTVIHNNYVYIVKIKYINIETLGERNSYAFLDEENVEDQHKRANRIFNSINTLLSKDFLNNEIEYYDGIITDCVRYMESNTYDTEDESVLKWTKSIKKYYIEDFSSEIKNNSNKFNMS